MKRITTTLLLMLSAWIVQGQELVELRYYFNATAQNLTYMTINAVEELDGNFEVNVNGLPQGVHQLYIDLRNSNGVWTHYDRLTIQVIGGQEMFTLNQMEYFFDSDPGMGNGIQVDVSGASFEGDVACSVAGLSNGLHRLYYRFRDGSNQWSHYHMQHIQVTAGGYNQLVRMEYFFDTDPGFGLANAIVLNGEGSLDQLFDIEVPNLPLGVHMLYVRLQDNSGQWSHYGQDTIVICDIQAPEVVISGTLCAGSDVVLTATEGYLSYAWNTGDQGNSTTVNASGNYTLEVTDEDCAATIDVPVALVEIPTPVIVANGNTLSVEEGDYDYIWQWNGDVVPNANAASWEGNASGTVTATYVYGDCTATSDPFEFTYIGIDESIERSFGVYPNPSRGSVCVRTSSSGDVVLIQADGRVLARQKITASQTVLEWGSQAAGLYFLQFIDQEGHVSTVRLEILP